MADGFPLALGVLQILALDIGNATLSAVMYVVVAGWRPGDGFPGGDMAMAAADAAFLTLVIAQTANAFACRSSTRWPARSAGRPNRLLLIPVASIELFCSLVVFFTIPIAAELEHATPPLCGQGDRRGGGGSDPDRRHLRQAQAAAQDRRMASPIVPLVPSRLWRRREKTDTRTTRGRREQ